MTNEELYYLPANELLKHIQSEKERLVNEKIIKKSKPLPPITEEEKPYDLPVGWEWVKLGQIGYSIIGLTYSPKDVCSSGSTILRSNNVKDGKINLINTVSVNKTIKKDLILKENDILLCSRNGSKTLVGKGAIIKDIGIGMSFGAFMTVYRSICNPYINYFIQSNFFRNQLEKCGTTTINQLTQDILLNIIVPLPPLYIQDQIVKKLEQLSETKDSLLSHAKSQLNYTKKMREALLQEAIRGELVPQDENDEPASVLLEKIKAEKERLIKEKIIKKSKPLPPITGEEKPYNLPNGWEWVRLGDLISILRGASPRPKGSPKYFSNERTPHHWITIWDITNNSEQDYLIDTREFLTKEGSLKSVYVKPGDIIIAVSGSIGKMAKLKIDGYIYDGLAVLKPICDLSESFITYFVQALQYELLKVSDGTSIKNINTEKLNNLLFPLPPLAEQERIVAKLDELIANCNQLEEKAQEIMDYTSKFFEASLKEAFMPE